MKQETLTKKMSFLDDKSRYAIDSSLDDKHEKDRNSPFMQRKMAQARAFLDKHGLPKGFGEWEKTGSSK